MRSTGGSASVTTNTARFTFRVRVSSTALGLLMAESDRCRWVWNECVARSQRAYREGTECGPAALDKMLTGARSQCGWLREGSSVAQQQVIRDFGRSRAKALKDIRERVPARRRAGMPRYKKKTGDRPTLNYTRQGFRLKQGRLYLAGGIELVVVWSRQLPSDPSSVRIYQDSLGHWYASFVVEVQAEPLPATNCAIGIDWGVKQVATTTSDEFDLSYAGYGPKAAVKLARYQRKMARRQPLKGVKPSRGYRAAVRQVARQCKKVARQRQDRARKWAKRLVRDFDRIAVEDFKPRCLARTRMARKAADSAIGLIKNALITMAHKHCRELHLVPPAYTTMDCSACGARTKHRLPLSQRTYVCVTCGFVGPRDKNSAQVMLARAGFNPAGVDRGRLNRPPGGAAA
ncbi:transposase [Nocardia sp. ET3-3]|uniref:Transposase n=1 Tax=Nocardia terrae TaxID=2675851 RepID=A0A7K1VB56_9NOCA|nr:RNA-guided endonuclease TnpB family protein [Nocardia terrae]MVU83741.1 transposase [Nocardia terrae]